MGATTTHKMRVKHRLVCRLKTWIRGDGGDFVPEGTPVEVFGWSQQDEGMLDVRCAAHVYADSYQCEELHGSDRPAVGTGLWLTVEPSDLVWDKINTVRLYE